MAIWYYNKTGQTAFYLSGTWIFTADGKPAFHTGSGYWYEGGVAKFYIKDKWVFSMSGDPSYYTD